MGFLSIDLKMPPAYDDKELRELIKRKLKIRDFSYSIERKSLDARHREVIWNLRIGVFSDELPGSDPEPETKLNIPRCGRGRKVVVVGSGPAGFFCAFVLQQAGFSVTLLERGSDVKQRTSQINQFEANGTFSEDGNYAFGEGGAGTFSDGKLTSRTKSISNEKKFVIDSYIAAGAPREIAYLAYPHIGTDYLRRIVANLRREFEDIGGKFLFNRCCDSLISRNGKIAGVICTNAEFDADFVVFATGHSAYDTIKMLINHGVQFENKPFAIGCRVEHPQELINKAQWGSATIPGLKAAEYRLTMSSAQTGLAGYTFCMCPGGTVVPATAFAGRSVVNGMSYYTRSGKFANSALVAAIDLPNLLGRDISVPEAIDWLDALERKFYDATGNFSIPATTISGFCNKSKNSVPDHSSYPLGLNDISPAELLPKKIVETLQEALNIFSRKLRGFENGSIMGLESKTSAPFRVKREENSGSVNGFKNLYVCGEGSGWAGGIISSAADGIRAALNICSKE